MGCFDLYCGFQLPVIVELFKSFFAKVGFLSIGINIAFVLHSVCWTNPIIETDMPKKILIVDDQPSLRQMLRFVLSSRSMNVIEAENGLDALEKLMNEPIDLVVVDWQMPKMDGLELVRRLRKMDIYKDTPIVIISCLDDIEARREACTLGVLTWLRKPFRMSEIQTIVEVELGIAPGPVAINDKRAASGCY